MSIRYRTIGTITSVSRVVLTNPCFAQIRTERPRVAEALKHYIAAGGGLLLVDQPANAHKVIDEWLYEQTAEKPTYSAWEKPFALPNFSTLQTKASLFRAARG